MNDELKNAIESEIAYQDWRWGVGPEHQHAEGEWFLILDKLVQDGKASWYESCRSPETLAYFRKIAATAVQAMLLHGYEERVMPASHEG